MLTVTSIVYVFFCGKCGCGDLSKLDSLSPSEDFSCDFTCKYCNTSDHIKCLSEVEYKKFSREKNIDKLTN